MCRWLAYCGSPIFLEDLVTRPGHSLLDQSRRCSEAKVDTNGDGFGVGWFGERDTPGLYRDVQPAWSDDNLLSLSAQIRSRFFFAHVRASTGTATSRANCHPFSKDQWLFMHNGQIGGYDRVRRKIEALIDDDLYLHRMGTTDSEALFLTLLGRGCFDGAAEQVAQKVAAVLGEIRAIMTAADIHEPLRVTAAFGDGKTLRAIRYSSDAFAPSLYFRRCQLGLSVVSEPLDETGVEWRSVPSGHLLTFSGEAAPEFVSLKVPCMQEEWGRDVARAQPELTPAQ